MTPELTPERRAALAAFYAAHHRRLAHAVMAGCHGADPAVIEDACGHAWLALVRRPDVSLDRRGLRWLTLTATQEAWRLAGPGRERPSGSFRGELHDTSELAEPASDAADPIELVMAHELHHERVARFAQLSTRQRRELLLHAAGYHYREIANLTATTYTAVNR